MPTRSWKRPRRAWLTFSGRSTGLAAAPDDTSAGQLVAPANQTLAVFQEAMDDDFNTAADVGHL
jgi:DALR domain